MHQHVVANGIALGVQAVQDAQWAAVQVARNTSACLHAVVNVELGVPYHAVSVFADLAG